ncbi:unnamed protein product [Clonostachys rosea f. rosea IK726]|jgi:quinate dehydrogenase|uniref:Uncharacterized protein n=1 Tax=Clonostachys rosea f. rosea IK726 TaxID=1349383 RepID=A0ACA9U5M1_BIOOC|nr:unnamed protein product [Clonostachys rosea f. rosea IK726]
MAYVDNIQKHRLYIAGAPGGSSIGPPVHEFIASELQKPWSMTFLQAENIYDVVKTYRRADFAGGLITMPWKKTIIPHLDEVDDLVVLTGACNLAYLTSAGKLRGANVDWIGIKTPLVAARAPMKDDVGMIYGAGGASRAALYTLAVELSTQTIYIANRDDSEAEDLIKDASQYDQSLKLNIIHVKTAKQAQSLPAPAYIISTVPDFEAKTPGEIAARSVLREFLARGKGQDNVVLDMCYHPRNTRNLKLASDFGWTIVDGVKVVGNQFRTQWKLWTGQEISKATEEAAFALLEEIAQNDPTVDPIPS